MRVRFTSPHPKDFPEDLLDLIAQRANICKVVPLPLQSGSTAVLQKMRRGTCVFEFMMMGYTMNHYMKQNPPRTY